MIVNILGALLSTKPARSFAAQVGSAVAAELMRPVPSKVPGRLRIPVRGVRKSPENARIVEKTLLALAGVRRVKANYITGNVLVEFDHEHLTPDNLKHLIEHEALGLLPLHNPHPVTASHVLQLAEAEAGAR